MKNLETNPGQFITNWNQSYITPEKMQKTREEERESKKDLIKFIALISFAIAMMAFATFVAITHP